MKNLLLASLVLLAVSCNKTKDWKCEVYFYKVENDKGEPSKVIFTGSKEEMKSYESKGMHTNMIGGVEYMVETKCK